MSGIIETQVLHTTTTRTLHAHNFNKSSSEATVLLTNVLSRYLTFLAETCVRYAEHGGRTGVTMWDALAALDELGVEIDELRNFAEGEAKDVVRYTAQTARRADELAEIKSIISDGLREESDVIQLLYQPILDDEESDEDVEMEVLPEFKFALPSTFAEDTVMTTENIDFEPNSPSPLSPPSSPKRPRLATWDPPDYIPAFLPPFPGTPLSENGLFLRQTTASPPETVPDVDMDAATPRSKDIDRPTVPSTEIASTVLQPIPENESQRPTQLPVRQPSPPLAATPSSSSSYLTAIPYEHSSLASVPEWHLPKEPPHQSPLGEPELFTLPALLSSHSYLQSVSLSAPAVLPPNPQRHTLAMILLGLSARAYSPAATLFASNSTNTCTPVPRRAAPLATHAVPLDKHGKTSFSAHPPKGTLPVPPPEWHARSAAGPVAFVQPTTMQGSKIPIIARMILSPPILAKSTRIVPPPPLERNDQKLLYGPPIPAPWNTVSGGSDVKGKGGKDKEEEEPEEANKALAEAHLFATWDYDPKDFRGSLPLPRRGSKVSGAGSGKRKRSESVLPGR